MSRKWRNCYQKEADEEIKVVGSRDKVGKERSVIFRQDNVGGRGRVTTDEERVLRVLRAYRMGVI